MAEGVWQATITDEKGNVLPGAAVTVRNSSGGGLATIHEDRDGLILASNPVFADANGFVRFFAADGFYDIEAVYESYSQEWQWQIILGGTTSGLLNVVEDTTPQLGGDLDANGFWIGFDDATGIEDDSGNEMLRFQKVASAVNYIDIFNAATGNPPSIEAVGDNTDVGLDIKTKGAGSLRLFISTTAEITLTATAFSPATSDGNALGTTSLMWSDLFLASGGVINWNNGDVLATHSANTLAFTGASSGYTFDAVVSISGNAVVTVAGNVNLTGGFTATSDNDGTITGNNQAYQPDPLTGNFKHVTLNGSSLTGTFTITPPASNCTIVLEITNGGSGAVGATYTVSGFTKAEGTFTTTNGHKFVAYITKTQNYSYINLVPLQ